MFCKYKDIFGKPGEGIHSARFLGMASVDLLGTIIFCCIVSLIFKSNFFITTICVFLFAVIFHKLFCVDTKLNKMIFGTTN